MTANKRCNRQCDADVIKLFKRRHLMIRYATAVVLFLHILIGGLHMYQVDLLWVMPSEQRSNDAPKILASMPTGDSQHGNEDTTTIQGICKRPLEAIKQRATSFPTPGKHPKFLFGIPSMLSSPVEKERRQLIRETYLNFDRQIYDMATKERHDSGTNGTTPLMLPPSRNRVCSLQEWTCNYENIHEECQIIYAFFVGGNPKAPPYILDESMVDFRSMLIPTTPNNNRNTTTEEPGLIRFDIRENQFDGKMTTWFQFAALIGQEFPEIDYAVKVDSDTLVFTPNFLENLEARHWKALNGRKNLKTERIYGGIKYPKTYCGKTETHHACPLPLVGDSYMSGELNFMSMDLARYIASAACPRDNITIPHEDVSLSNYVYSYTDNPKINATDTTIDKIFIQQERVLLTFNESADWESRKAGRSVNLQEQYRKFLWGHCNPRPMKNDALYTYFKDPKKVQKIWNDFVSYYYQGVYGNTTTGLVGTNVVSITDNRGKSPSVQSLQGAPSNFSTSCAILFFGLPRSFKRYVLPSIVRNVVVPNLYYDCDYYAHFYQVDREQASRSGHAGEINAEDVFLLKDAIHQAYRDSSLNFTNAVTRLPQVSFVSDTNETFWESRGDLVGICRTAKRKDGNYLYYPYMEQNYVYPTTMDNIVKQWHSIDAVWKKMEEGALRMNKTYDRVTMLRSDVIFINPIDVYQTNSGVKDIYNEFMTIPDWAGWPVNDRMVSGPYEAVKVWATERFPRLDKYVRTNVIARSGYGMHPEKFLNGEIIPHITNKLGYKIDLNKRFCFVRVRADGGIWIDDCNKGFPGNNAYATFQRDLLPENAFCVRQNFSAWANQLYCNFTGEEHGDLLWNLKEKPI